MKKNIKFLGVSSGICAPTASGKMGAELGFDAIRAIALREDAALFIKNEVKRVIDLDHLYSFLKENKKYQRTFLKDLKRPKKRNTNYARHIEYLKTVFDKIRTDVNETLSGVGNIEKKSMFPFVIAGDHSTAAATIGGIKQYLAEKEPGKKLGVIWVDAHVDAHSPFSTPTGNMHGMPVGIAFNLQTNEEPKKEDSKTDKERNVDKRIKDAWSSLCGIGGKVPMINRKQLVYIGIRSWEPHEEAFLKQRRIKYFHLSRPDEKKEASQITKKEGGKYGEIYVHGNSRHFRNQTIEKVCKETLKYFKDLDYIYVSFDIDSIDGDIVPGTGTPVRYGLGVDEAKYILKYFWENKTVPLIAMEVVEVSPLLDHKNKTAKTAFEIIKSLADLENETVKNN
jgi:arginase